MIVCVGDSITYGQHLEDPTRAWPWLLRNHAVFAAGVPGDTTRLGLIRFPRDVQDMNPTAVIIQFGHNDANRWQTDRGLPRVSDRSFMANLEEMIDRSRAFHAEPFLCSITPTRRSEEHARDCARYDQIVREVASVNLVILIDVRAAFTDDRYLMDDGLHLTELGHRAYAAEVQRVLDREGVE